MPPEYTDDYCKGPCLEETNHVLDCMDGILKGFLFLNRATLDNVRDTIESGCGYGPKRGACDSFPSFDYVEASFSNVFELLQGILMCLSIFKLMVPARRRCRTPFSRRW